VRGTKAKRLRRQVYGDYAHRETRYAINEKTRQIRAIGLRAEYQKAKIAARLGSAAGEDKVTNGR